MLVNGTPSFERCLAHEMFGLSESDLRLQELHNPEVGHLEP